MALERWLVWLVGLVAVAASILAYASPGVALPAELVAAVLVAVVALPLAVVLARRLLSYRKRTRGWS